MKVATKFKILLLSVACAALALAAGCSIGETTVEDFLKGEGAYDKYVTYSASGGTFNGTGNLKLLNIYYPEENEVIYNFDNSPNLSIARAGYVFNGWCYAKLNENNEPVTDDDGYFVASENVVNTSVSVTLKAGEHLYLCAVWVPDVSVDIVLVIDGDDGNAQITGVENKKYSSGDVIDTKVFSTAGTVSLSNATAPMASTDYTFLQYYLDEACTTVLTGTVSRPTGANAQNPKVYAKYIKGVYTIVRNDTQVASMLNTPVDGRSYYLFPDSGNEIDCTRRALSLKTDGALAMNYTIIGNGVTLKNLKYTAQANNGSVCSMFGIFGKNAKISDLTIENINMNITANGDVTAHIVNSGIEEGAKFENVTINGATLTITAYGTIFNIQQVNGQYGTGNWIFGGMDTDEAFVAGTGITITCAKIVIGVETVSEK